jgi:F-type H+-transporting ATPase subunit epsilon
MAVSENKRERLRLKIIALDRILYDDDIIQAAITTTSGDMVILKDHMPIAAIMADAPVFVKTDLIEEDIIVVHGGYMSVLENEMLIVADDAIFASEIDNARVQEDIRQNQEMLSKGEADEFMLERAEIQLRRDLMNLKAYDILSKKR